MGSVGNSGVIPIVYLWSRGMSALYLPPLTWKFLPQDVCPAPSLSVTLFSSQQHIILIVFSYCLPYNRFHTFVVNLIVHLQLCRNSGALDLCWGFIPLSGAPFL